jgi:hypothetical protein
MNAHLRDVQTPRQGSSGRWSGVVGASRCGVTRDYQSWILLISSLRDDRWGLVSLGLCRFVLLNRVTRQLIDVLYIHEVECKL